jgi:GNAT superfamily N-acetyltransferase
MVEDVASGQAVAYARVMRAEQLDGTRRYGHMARMEPAWRRKGIGAALLGWLEARASEIDATLEPNANTVFETWAMDTQAGNIALLTGNGYAPARYGYEMTRPLDDTPIADFPLPDGFEIRPATPEHYRAIWDADVEAFRDHNGFAEPGEARYQAWLNDPLFFQPDLWKVAWDVETNEVAGMVQNFINGDENAKLNRKRGYTEGISVRRPYRRRGLARALIVESLRMHKALGMTEAALGVDATNPTGALRVYEDCGFKAVKTEIVYRKRMR